MSNIKKIPCRVCNKLFEPCAVCQSNSDTFRWRNFACSKKCAEKYIKNTIEYRNSQKTNVEKEINFNKTLRNKNVKKPLLEESITSSMEKYE